MFFRKSMYDTLYNLEIEVNSNSMSIDEMYKKIIKMEKEIKELKEGKENKTTTRKAKKSK